MKKTGLVIIDMQNGFINAYTMHLPEQIKKFIMTHDFDSIIATRYCNTPETPCYQDGWTECMNGTPAAELVPELSGLTTAIFEKHIYSAFTPEFSDFILHKQLEKLYFCGVNTDCCVLASVFSCYDKNQDCTVIADLCASTLGTRIHENALEILRGNITREKVILSGTI